MMHQSEWDLLSLYVVLNLSNTSILTPRKAQAIEFNSDGEEVRNLSVFEEHYAKVVNGTIFHVNGVEYLVLNKTYFSYGYDCEVCAACERIFMDANTLIGEYNS
jgi:hypothetical protein